MATYENDSNDSIGSRRRGAREIAPPLGPFYGTAGPLPTRLDAVGHPLDAEGNAISGREFEDARIFRNGLEYVQTRSTPADYFPQFGGAQYVATDPQFGFIVPASVNLALAQKSNAMHGDAVTKFADGGGVFFLLAGGALALVGGAAAAAAGGAEAGGGATGVATFSEGATVNVFDDFLGSIGIDPGSLQFQGGGVLDNVAVGIEPGVPSGYDFGNALRDIGIDPDSLQFKGGGPATGNPWDFSGPAPSGTTNGFPKLPSLPGQSSALSSLLKSVLGGGGPGVSPAGTVVRPGANNYVFLPGGGTAAGGRYFPGVTAGGAVDTTALVWVIVGVGLIVAFASMKG